MKRHLRTRPPGDEPDEGDGEEPDAEEPDAEDETPSGDGYVLIEEERPQVQVRARGVPYAPGGPRPGQKHPLPGRESGDDQEA